MYSTSGVVGPPMPLVRLVRSCPTYAAARPRTSAAAALWEYPAAQVGAYLEVSDEHQVEGRAGRWPPRSATISSPAVRDAVGGAQSAPLSARPWRKSTQLTDQPRSASQTESRPSAAVSSARPGGERASCSATRGLGDPRLMSLALQVPATELPPVDPGHDQSAAPRVST